jgi:transposase-like protein
MGRPPSDVDDFVEWQDRLECQRDSGLSVEEFCSQEGVPKSTFYRWVNQLKGGIPQALLAAAKARKQTESSQPKFLPVSLQASPIEIEFPNGTVVRLPLSIGRPLLLEVIRIAGALRPWKMPKL